MKLDVGLEALYPALFQFLSRCPLWRNVTGDFGAVKQKSSLSPSGRSASTCRRVSPGQSSTEDGRSCYSCRDAAEEAGGRKKPREL